MYLVRAFFLFICVIHAQSNEECANNDLKPITYGNCDNVDKKQRIIYSKMCINEYDHRNYTLGWSGQEEITCIRMNTNGNVYIFSGGIGQYFAGIFVESTEGQELEWVAEIFEKPKSTPLHPMDKHSH